MVDVLFDVFVCVLVSLVFWDIDSWFDVVDGEDICLFLLESGGFNVDINCDVFVILLICLLVWDDLGRFFVVDGVVFCIFC